MQATASQRIGQVGAQQAAQVRTVEIAECQDRRTCADQRAKPHLLARLVAQHGIERQLAAGTLLIAELRQITRGARGRWRGQQRRHEHRHRKRARDHRAASRGVGQSGMPSCAMRRIAVSIGICAMPCVWSIQPLEFSSAISPATKRRRSRAGSVCNCGFGVLWHRTEQPLVHHDARIDPSDEQTSHQQHNERSGKSERQQAGIDITRLVPRRRQCGVVLSHDAAAAR